MEKEKSEKEMGNEWIKKLFMIYRLSIIDYSNTQSIFYTNVPYQARNAINLHFLRECVETTTHDTFMHELSIICRQLFSS